MLRVTSNERTTVERLRTTSTLSTTVAGGVFNLCLHARNVYTHTLASFQRTARGRKVTRDLPEGACVMLCRAVPSALLVYLSCIAAAVEGRLAGVEVELANGDDPTKLVDTLVDGRRIITVCVCASLCACRPQWLASFCARVFPA